MCASGVNSVHQLVSPHRHPAHGQGWRVAPANRTLYFVVSADGVRRWDRLYPPWPSLSTSHWPVARRQRAWLDLARPGGLGWLARGWAGGTDLSRTYAPGSSSTEGCMGSDPWAGVPMHPMSESSGCSGMSKRRLRAVGPGMVCVCSFASEDQTHRGL